MTVLGAKHWESVYTEKEEAAVSWFQQRPTIPLQLIASTGVERGARIVDIGGGASRLVDALLDAGYHELTVLDIASAALAKSRERLGARAESVRWIASDLKSWTPESSYDVWHDRAVFHFMVTPEDRAAYLSVLKLALRYGGHAIIATFASNGPERCSGLPIQRYEPAELAEMLGSDFSLAEEMREEHLTPAKKVQAFQYSRFLRTR